MTLIKYPPHAASRTFVVYQHVIGNQLLYIGRCRLSELIQAPDAKRNSKWSEMVQPDTFIEVTMLSMFATEPEAIIYQAGKIAELQPYANIKGVDVSPASRQVQCEDTGETFVNAATACRAYNISPSVMSNHLARMSGFKTVKGHTFKRI